MSYHAIAVDTLHFYYICPHEVCPAIVHTHSSRSNTLDRIESRHSHCIGDKYNRIEVKIDRNTLRKSLTIRGSTITFKKV